MRIPATVPRVANSRARAPAPQTPWFFGHSITQVPPTRAHLAVLDWRSLRMTEATMCFGGNTGRRARSFRGRGRPRHKRSGSCKALVQTPVFKAGTPGSLFGNANQCRGPSNARVDSQANQPASLRMTGGRGCDGARKIPPGGRWRGRDLAWRTAVRSPELTLVYCIHRMPLNLWLLKHLNSPQV